MPVLSVERLPPGPYPTDSPFLFAVHHLDKYPPGNEKMAPAASLRGHNIGADFGNPDGWSMYHGESVPGFPKHPHRGFETITVARRGYVDHTDSLGNGGRFGGGDVQWMTAGAGISHAEMFPCLDQRKSNVLDLFQIWLNLPKRSKMSPPTFKMLWAETIPHKTIPLDAGGRADLALYVGSLDLLDALPPPPPSHSYAAEADAAVLVLTITLSAGATWALPAAAAAPAKLHRNLYLFAGGSALIDGRQVAGRMRVKVAVDSPVPLVNRGDEPLQLLLLQGRDIGEPVVQHGPFVGNTRADIMQAFEDYQRTGFGAWPWPSDAMAFPRTENKRFALYADGTREERPMEDAEVCAP